MLEFPVCFEAEADGVADVLVGFAEGDALVGEVGCGGHGVEVASVGCGLHGLEAEFEGCGEGGEDAEDSGDGVGCVEDWLLAFLEALFVGEGEALDEGGGWGGW